MATSLPTELLMNFAQRLLKLRKHKGLTQQALADLAELHVVQVRRYETEASQPSLEAIRKLAIALRVSADQLLFDDNERGPADELKLQFEAISQLAPEEQRVAREVIEGLIIKYQSQRWDRSRETSAA